MLHLLSNTEKSDTVFLFPNWGCVGFITNLYVGNVLVYAIYISHLFIDFENTNGFRQDFVWFKSSFQVYKIPRSKHSSNINSNSTGARSENSRCDFHHRQTCVIRQPQAYLHRSRRANVAIKIHPLPFKRFWNPVHHTSADVYSSLNIIFFRKRLSVGLQNRFFGRPCRFVHRFYTPWLILAILSVEYIVHMTNVLL